MAIASDNDSKKDPNPFLFSIEFLTESVQKALNFPRLTCRHRQVKGWPHADSRLRHARYTKLEWAEAMKEKLFGIFGPWRIFGTSRPNLQSSNLNKAHGKHCLTFIKSSFGDRF